MKSRPFPTCSIYNSLTAHSIGIELLTSQKYNYLLDSLHGHFEHNLGSFTSRKGVVFYQKFSPKHVQFHQKNEFLIKLDMFCFSFFWEQMEFYSIAKQNTTKLDMFWLDFLVEHDTFSTSDFRPSTIQNSEASQRHP